MDKEQIKAYLAEAVDAMNEQDLEYLFPDSSRPDLYTIAAELVSIKGEMKKLSATSLMLNNQVKNIVENLKPVEETAQNEAAGDRQNEDMRQLLDQLIEQHDLMKRTEENFTELPAIEYFTLGKFKRSFAAWQKGYEITMEKWNQLIKRTGLLKTGYKGQPFDPAYHEAIAVTHHPDMGNNVIVDTEVEGYIYKQKLIRQAKVVVNKHA